ncbi:MAG: hypothetical protein ABIF40_03190 [archaeon]
MRIGKKFEFGYPCIGQGLGYRWPDEEIDYNLKLKEQKEELGKFLLEKTKEYIETFEISTYRGYPYLQFGDDGFAIHIGDGGRWVDIGNQMFNALGSFHNLDYYGEHFAGFNLASDTLEYLDETIKAPRILKNDIVQYSLPNGSQIIPPEIFPKQEILQRFFDIAQLGTIENIQLDEDQQIINKSQGIISITNGVCEGKEFHGFHLNKATKVIAYLLTAFNV